MNRIVTVLVLAAAACARVGTVEQSPRGQTVIMGTVRSATGQRLSGLVLLEKGELHGNRWDRGALADAEGRYRIELAEGGQYGVHTYANGHFYHPKAAQVETGKTLELNVVLLPELPGTLDPVIKRVTFEETGVQMDVADANNNLGPQVLAFHAATGRAFAMSPPTPVSDLKANFPQGVYRLSVDTARGPINRRDWHFVVADHECFTSDILSFPHKPKDKRALGDDSVRS